MQIGDFVQLINDTEELSAKNIFKGYGGVLLSYINLTDEWVVMFLNSYNYGIYAVAKAKAHDLKFICEMPNEFVKEFLEKIESPNFYSHIELKPPKFKEYDKVVLINEKPRYIKEGLKKGDTGRVMSTYAIKNEWQIIFSEKDTGKDIADISVHEDDIELAD